MGLSGLCASSVLVAPRERVPDSDLEAFSHNPAHGSFAPLAFQPSAMTNCANRLYAQLVKRLYESTVP